MYFPDLTGKHAGGKTLPIWPGQEHNRRIEGTAAGMA
jgi:hypothetical protein